ncbi:Glycerol-3-phosphate ABC transporter, periplasmic glycerol-3-phosphate-binding protein [Serinicoccus hydrothermalis]|uniref:Glycerol-3-phosphate ABC transporter, periplasmic glycerol-3-phosphate-binding protein n=1 Tax=Serinicoccus hydrothermalis TaxID=1758689 RepID=A0A1B1N8X9_9MICO|nr:ABC transporter substrate-binding protein [Serinicoccus hydrothermalis]ANS77876.1 Glycerol-3-phosphate ABC transporter, periplasmic glycerol-3-phosphate-binding protein [Serinicoccus hydrothermalis]
MSAPRRTLALAATLSAGALVLTACGGGGGAGSDGSVDLTMYYPVAVGGPLTDVVDDLIASCTEENEGISVEAVYSGTYADTMTKAQTASRSNQGPDLAVLLTTDLYTLMDGELIVPLSTLDDDLSWTEDRFYPAYLASGQAEDELWSLPFQRSTIVQYHNKDVFEEAGLDPEAPPTTWDELEEQAATIQDSGAAEYGLEIPSTQFGNWMFQAMAIQSGVEDTAGVDGIVDYLDAPGSVEALEWWRSMTESGIMPSGTTEWASTPEDFLQGRTGIMWHTTGNLTNVRSNADFDFGVSILPANTQPGSPTGGGNLYVFDRGDEETRAAAYTIARCLTEPERAAEWSMRSGYVATGPEAWETDTMVDYAEEFPQAAVARDQLEVAVGETTSHENGRVSQMINDTIAAVLTGQAEPEPALTQLQSDIDGVLAPYQGR